MFLPVSVERVHFLAGLSSKGRTKVNRLNVRLQS